MGFFEKEPAEKKARKPRAPQDPEKKQEIMEKKAAWEGFKKQMKENPELEKAFVFKKMGMEIPKDDPVERQRQKIKAELIEEAAKVISEDPELRKLYAEGMIGEIIGKNVKIPRKNGDDGEVYMESDSSIERALGELDNLAELKTKLDALGIGGEGGKKGFFDGITLKDLIGLVMMIKGGGIMGGGNGNNEQRELPPPENYYMVQIDGRNTRVNESTYRQMLKEGRIKPIAMIEAPKEESVASAPKEDNVDEIAIAPVVSDAKKPETPQPISEQPLGIELPSLDMILQYTDMETIESYLYMDPDEVVTLLKSNLETSPFVQFVWGLLTNTTYEGVVNILNNYRGDSRAEGIINEINSEAGKSWVNMILEKIAEASNATASAKQ